MISFINRISIYFILTILPLVGYAVDIPTNVIGAENFSKEECIASNTNDCIEAVCMTSTALDCSAQCKSDATDKCEAMAEQ